MVEDESFLGDFTGFILEEDKSGLIYLSQNDNLQKLERLPDDDRFSQFRSMNIKFAWVGSRPDCLFDIAKITEQMLDDTRAKY